MARKAGDREVPRGRGVSAREKAKRRIVGLLRAEGVLDQRQIARRLGMDADYVCALMEELRGEGRITPAPRRRSSGAGGTAVGNPKVAAAGIKEIGELIIGVKKTIEGIVAPTPKAAEATARNWWRTVQPRMTLLLLQLVEKWERAPEDDRDWKAGIVCGFAAGVQAAYGDWIAKEWTAEAGQHEAWRRFVDRELNPRRPEGPPKEPPKGGEART